MYQNKGVALLSLMEWWKVIAGFKARERFIFVLNKVWRMNWSRGSVHLVFKCLSRLIDHNLAVILMWSWDEADIVFTYSAILDLLLNLFFDSTKVFQKLGYKRRPVWFLLSRSFVSRRTVSSRCTRRTDWKGPLYCLLWESYSFMKEKNMLQEFTWAEFEWRVCKGPIGWTYLSLKDRRKGEATRKVNLRSRECSLRGLRAGRCDQ